MAFVEPPPAFTSSADSTSSQAEALNDPAPIYQEAQYADIWAKWDAVDNSSRRATELQGTLSELEPGLKEMTKKYEILKQKSLQLFEKLHHKPKSFSSIPNPLKRVGSRAPVTESREQIMEEFEAAHREEMAELIELDALRDRVDQVNTQLQINLIVASEADQVFELIGAQFSSQTSDELAIPAEIVAADQRLENANASLREIDEKLSDFERAQTCVQHAHHYYTLVLQTLDAVRGSTFSRALFGGAGEMSKNTDYRVAADTSSKAQVCFTEAAKKLEPYMRDLPEDICSDFETLKEMSLLQASKIYHLMYGWQSNSTGVRKSMKLMLDKQEKVFACLTRFAVWVQDKIPVIKREVGAVRMERDNARRTLVLLWKNQMLGPPSPSLDHSEVILDIS